MLHLLLSFPPAHLLTFIAGALVVNFAPGADVLFATASGIRGGPRIGALAGLGVGCGVLMHVTLAAFGLSAAIAAFPGALVAIRWLGAAYLLYLAWRSWRDTGALPEGRGAGSAWTAIRRGFISNATNPKPMLFMMAFLPQFTDRALGPVWEQIVVLGLIFCFTGTLVTMGYGVLAGYVRHALGRRMVALNRVSALMFGGLALKLIAD